MATVLNEIITILTSGITGIATGVGNGLQSLVTNIFLVAGPDGAYTLSTVGGIAVCFGGIALAIGLCRLVVSWVTSLGGRKM